MLRPPGEDEEFRVVATGSNRWPITMYLGDTTLHLSVAAAVEIAAELVKTVKAVTDSAAKALIGAEEMFARSFTREARDTASLQAKLCAAAIRNRCTHPSGLSAEEEALVVWARTEAANIYHDMSQSNRWANLIALADAMEKRR
jgi:hypothetical protein